MKISFPLLSALLISSLALSACSTLNKSAVTMGELTGVTTLVKAGTQMTPRQSYYLGRTCAARVLSTNQPVTSEELSDYVNTLGKYLALHSQSAEIYKGYQFVVLEGDAPNAVSTPGGFVFISTGMVALAQSEDELAAVLAHEISHISLKHAEEAIQTANRLDLLGGLVIKTASMATDYATKKVGLDDFEVMNLKVMKVLKVFDVVLDAVINTGFNQPQEFAADQEAIQILRSAGYSPAALSEIIAKLNDDASFVGLHPGGSRRINAINKTIAADRSIASDIQLEPSLPKTQERFFTIRSTLRPVGTVDDRY